MLKKMGKLLCIIITILGIEIVQYHVPMSVVQAAGTQQKSQKIESVMKAYSSYISEKNYLKSKKYTHCSLFYLDEDEVPECALIGSSMGDGVKILYYSNNKIYEVCLMRQGFSYIEQRGLLLDSSGNMGSFFDIVYEFKNGKMKKIEEQWWSMQYDSSKDKYIENYKWDKKKVSKELYYKKLNAVFNSKLESDIYKSQYSTLEEAYANLKPPTIKKVKYTMNANGGKVSGRKKYSKKLTVGKFIEKLKVPSRKGFTFKGWYTKKKGGVKITSKQRCRYSASVTLYARWKKR